LARVLALDVGSSSVRAQVFDERGRPCDEGSQLRYATDDPDEIVWLVREAMAGRQEGVDAVGASCFGHSLIAVDEDGRPLTPVLGWRDVRAADAAEWLAGRLDPKRVHARTGCHLHPSYWPAKLAWLAKSEPDVFRRARRFVSFCDYLTMELLGCEPVSSLSMASCTGLLDLNECRWDEELLDALELDEARLPGLSDEPVNGWYPAWFDGVCSNVGAGCVGEGRAALMVGTSGALRVVYESERARPRPGLFLYRIDRLRVVEGGALSDGGNLHSWLERTLRDTEGSLEERDPDSHGLTFLALLGGERSVGWNPRAAGAILGLTLETTPLDLLQAALEGVAFRFAEIADLLPDLEDVVATGHGLLADRTWIQIMADALGRPVTASGVAEASLRGAAVLALERLGFEAETATLGEVFEPRRDRADAYRSARARQRALYELNRRWNEEPP
jgi:gluconokinase